MNQIPWCSVARAPCSSASKSPANAATFRSSRTNASTAPCASPSYVDGPQWQALFGALNDLIGCGHMSGLLMRSICPLALMKSDDLDPYHHRSELFAHDGLRVIPGLRWRPCRSSRLVALAKLEPVNLSCEHSLRRCPKGFLKPSRTSRCGSPRRSSSSRGHDDAVS